MAEGLCAADPAMLQDTGQTLVSILSYLRRSGKKHYGIYALPSRNIVTFHEAFPYFAKEVNVNIVAERLIRVCIHAIL
ncbi:MAG TPA: hypothetical protein DCO75_03435 [Fibrobacteres bacterium]|nr:hypothetical protein [Fibrobacterota bacterium]